MALSPPDGYWEEPEVLGLRLLFPLPEEVEYYYEDEAYPPKSLLWPPDPLPPLLEYPPEPLPLCDDEVLFISL